MLESIIGAVFIMILRICDVTIGTFRTLLVVQSKRTFAGVAGFFEVLIWIFAMRYIVEHMDNTINLFGYAAGFGLGNVLGISLEGKFAIGYLQINIISKHFTDKIADALRMSKFGVTILPAEGSTGGVSILVVIIRRKDQKSVMKIIESVDPDAFITLQQARAFRGFIHGSRK